MVRKGEVGFGIFIANAANEGIKKIPVVRNLSVLHIGGDEITEETPEVFVAGIGQEGA